MDPPPEPPEIEGPPDLRELRSSQNIAIVLGAVFAWSAILVVAAFRLVVFIFQNIHAIMLTAFLVYVIMIVAMVVRLSSIAGY